MPTVFIRDRHPRHVRRTGVARLDVSYGPGYKPNPQPAPKRADDPMPTTQAIQAFIEKTNAEMGGIEPNIK